MAWPLRQSVRTVKGVRTVRASELLDSRLHFGNDSVSHGKSIELHQSRRYISFARHRENRLTESAPLEHEQDFRIAMDVHLSERIVEQQQRLGARAFLQRRRFEHA